LSNLQFSFDIIECLLHSGKPTHVSSEHLMQLVDKRFAVVADESQAVRL